jgi:teichuronic acid biosynthesis glycosyltransferase TuaG
MSGPPAVSVIVPFRNAAATLGATLDSLAAQTCPDWEALLIDDASSDGGPALAQARAAADGRLRVLATGARAGAAGARNLGIRAARGRFIAFLDADDTWLPDKLALQLPVLRAGAPIVFSAYDRVDAAGRRLGTVAAAARVCHADALAGNPIGCLTAVWDSARLGRAEMPLLPLHEDYAFWLGLLRTGACAVGLPQVLARYRVADGTLSARKWQAARATWGILRAEPGLSLPQAATGFARYALKALARRV